MPNVKPVDPESLPAELSRYGRDPFYGILGRRPEILAAWAALDETFFGPSSTVPNPIKEEGRRSLAQDVGCAFCASLGEPCDSPSDARGILAASLGDQIAHDHTRIGASTFEELRQEFSDEEIVELVSWLCFKFGSNVFGALMKLSPASEEQVGAYARFVAQD
jgi:alkylhydroperoxidase family enzyme